MSIQRSIFLALSLSAAFSGFSCSSNDEFDLSGEISPIPIGDEGSKDDGVGNPAVAVNANVSDTEVWPVRHMWEERNETPEARAAGMAWPENSGLSWDEKYSAWISAMRKIPASSDQTYGDTYELMTPYGKTLAAPALECAEVAMFQRAVFAAWYGLPFFMEGIDDQKQRIFFGHFGARTASGRWRNSPLFSKYAANANWKQGDAWPTDSTLSKMTLDGNKADANDIQPAISKDAHLGAYLDQIFVNKRAGYFILFMLDYFYSGSLADPVNTYNLKPEAIRAGDVLIRRWQRNGIGHTMLLKTVRTLDSGLLMAEIVQGGMPRHQGQWTDEVEAKSSLMDEDAGGDGATSDTPPIPYWKLGGGIKRWRVARALNGMWTNTYMPEDKVNWINSTDPTNLVPRPKHFGDILGEVPPEQKRDSLLAQITAQRANLQMNPSSCESRTERENAFDSLRGLAEKLNTTQDALMKQYHTLDDFVFTPLYYSSAKTCCWDTSSASMYRIVMDYAKEEQANATAQMKCVTPTVFRAHPDKPAGYTGPMDGYQLWRDWAAKKGRSAEWVDANGKPAEWHEDETCDQRANMDDSENSIYGGAYCDLFGPPPPPDPTPVDMGTAPNPPAGGGT
jgi:hypothetical protein